MRTLQKRPKKSSSVVCNAIKNDIDGMFTHGEWKRLRRHTYMLVGIYKPDICEDKSVGFISYVVPNKDKRVKAKTGRFLTKKLGLGKTPYNFNPARIEGIASRINLELFGASDDCFKMLTGDAITDAYRNEIGGHSCMTDEYADYTLLYAANPEVISMLTIKVGSYHARAMVFLLDSGDTFMDRVYSNDETLRDKMRSYAKEHGWFYRHDDEPEFNGIHADKGEHLHRSELRDYCVSGLDYEDGHVPWMDSLSHGMITDDSLTISFIDGYYDLQNDDGYFAGGGGCTCCSCCHNIHEDDSIHHDDEYYCGECFNDIFNYCGECQDYHHNDDVTFVDSGLTAVCDDCLSDSYTCCADCEEYVRGDDVRHVESQSKVVCDGCIGDYTRCDECDDHVLNSDLVGVDGGTKQVCEECAIVLA